MTHRPTSRLAEHRLLTPLTEAEADTDSASQLTLTATVRLPATVATRDAPILKFSKRKL